MALTPFDFTRDIFSPAEEFFGGGLLRPFEPMLRSRESGLPIAMPRAMALDVKELDNAFDVKADIPGVSKNDIQINVDNNVLTIRVDKKDEKTEEKEEEGTKWHRWERTSNFQMRSLRLPATADLDNVHAKYENGVLELQVPKKEIKETGKRIDIQ